MAYSIDSSGILDLFRYYPPDVFPTIWTQMDSAASSGIIFAVDEVYRELEKKDDAAFQWLKARRTIVVALDTEIQRRVAAILAVHPRLIDTRRNRSSGDPFVIALAQVRAFSVVTGERASGVLAKPNIPDVCAGSASLGWVFFQCSVRRAGGPDPSPRTNFLNFRLRFPHSSGINNSVESSVWLAGRLSATLVARPASK